jgi:hypothetical protein
MSLVENDISCLMKGRLLLRKKVLLCNLCAVRSVLQSRLLFSGFNP